MTVRGVDYGLIPGSMSCGRAKVQEVCGTWGLGKQGNRGLRFWAKMVGGFGQGIEQVVSETVSGDRWLFWQRFGSVVFGGRLQLGAGI
jgi:hypothetical protein